MKPTTRLCRFLLLLAMGAVLSCDDEPVGPSPAVYDVVLGRGPAQVGAILMLIEGGSVDTVEGIGYYTASAPYSGVATQVLVAGSQLGGTLVRLRVPDSRGEYRAVALEIAEPGTHRLLPTSDYSLSLIRVRR
jgi:hypothetical protein